MPDREVGRPSVSELLAMVNCTTKRMEVPSTPLGDVVGLDSQSGSDAIQVVSIEEGVGGMCHPPILREQGRPLSPDMQLGST